MTNTRVPTDVVACLDYGNSLGNAFEEYLNLMESGLRHEKLPAPLQAVALRGLKISTGLDIADWRALCGNWLSVIESAKQGDARALYANIEDWEKRFQKYLVFLEKAPIGSKRFFGDEESQADVDTLFVVKGATLVKQLIAWLDQSSKSLNCLSDSANVFVDLSNLAVCVNNIQKRYNDIIAVDGISIEIQKGEIFGVLGPNGAGKTSLIECIEGIRSPETGEITIMGQKYDRTKRIYEKIGIQLQSTGFYPTLTVKETIKMYAAFFKRSRPTSEILSLVGMEAKSSSLVGNLSGGQRQRLSLAIALVNDPDILFLDEPTVGLDPAVRHELWEIIFGLRNIGKTIFITTHYMDEAEKLCNRVAIIDAGKIIELGSPSDLIQKYIGNRTIEIIYSDPVEVSDFICFPDIIKCKTNGCRAVLISSNEKATLSALLAKDEQKTRIQTLSVRQGSLEDVFLMLTNKVIE